jgi:hypothetical protein
VKVERCAALIYFLQYKLQKSEGSECWLSSWLLLYFPATKFWQREREHWVFYFIEKGFFSPL